MKRFVPILSGVLLLGVAALTDRQRSRPLPTPSESARQIEMPREADSVEDAPGERGSPSTAAAGPEPLAHAVSPRVNVAVPDLAPIPLFAGNVPAEMQIEAIARRTDVPDGLKARALLQMLPGLPEEALAKAADEAASRLPDSDYAAVLLPVVVAPGTHGTAMRVLFADLMERPDAITLPALLTIARNPAHPYATAAHDNLELLLGADFGRDWRRWDVEVRQRLAAGR